MAWVLSIAGAGLIVVGLYDLFRTFIHPSARGRLSTALMTAPWRVSRRLTGAPSRAAGPVGVLLVMLMWVMLQIVGWALVYLPHVETGFAYSEQVTPGQFDPIAEAFYMSAVVLGTLGLGDVVVTQPALRLVSPLQALAGFALLTASISWLLQLYPALARRRAWALHLAYLNAADFGAAIAQPGTNTAGVVHDLAVRSAAVRIDLGQHPETYCFTERAPATCLPHAMQHAWAIASAAEASSDAATAAAGSVLRESMRDLGAFLHERFVPRASRDPDDLIDAIAHDRGCRCAL